MCFSVGSCITTNYVKKLSKELSYYVDLTQNLKNYISSSCKVSNEVYCER